MIYASATDGNSANNDTSGWDAQKITVTGRPGLIVQSILTDPVSPYAGQTTTVTVKNKGTGAAGTFYVDFYKHLTSAPTPGLVGTFRCSGTLPAGAAGTCTNTTSWSPAGTYSMWAQAAETLRFPVMIQEVQLFDEGAQPLKPEVKEGTLTTGH